MGESLPHDAPQPRLCHVKKVADFNGYGFNLHAEKGKAGQFIGKIDPGSPAETAGLLENDRIVEVNGTNIGNENHQQVVQRIKAVPNETRMLVVDKDTDKYYQDKGIVIRGDMSNVKQGSDGSVVNNVEDINPPSRPRLCHIKLWTDFQGYGFNLHAEKNKPGQYIGKVDNDSPAEAGGLREGDRIIEVNGQSVVTDTHAGVVQKVKQRQGETSLLVVDREADDWFKDENINVHSALPCVQSIQCPPSKTANLNGMAGGCPHEARLCHVKKWADYDGYGFNMHCVKNKSGEFIGKVEDGSPADLAGLREGDHVIEVNGNNIAGESHAQVIGRIKDSPGETKLLVVDPDAEAYFDNNGISVHGYMEHMTRITCPDFRTTANGTATPEHEQAEPPQHIENHDDGALNDYEYPNQNEAELQGLHDSHEDIRVPTPPRSRSPSPIAFNPYEDVRDPSPDHREPSPVGYYEERQPSREPSREPSPEPYRAPTPEREDSPIMRERTPSPEYRHRDPTPEPVRDPTPEPPREPTPEPPRDPTPEPPREPTPEPVRDPTPEPIREPPAPVAMRTAAPVQSSGPVNVGGISFGSIAEARARVSRKKRESAREAQISAKDKYDMFQRL